MKLKILILFVLSFSLLHSEIRFVSKEGLSKPPYTSWETASDSIQKCINICLPGDTIYVGYGVYEEQLVLNEGISLIGIDRDSCIINSSFLTGILDIGLNLKSNTRLKNLSFIIHSTPDYKIGVNIDPGFTNIIIENNKFINGKYAINAYLGNVDSAFCIIRNNQFNNCMIGFYVVGKDNNNYPLFENNVLYNVRYGVFCFSKTTIRVNNNIIYTNDFKRFSYAFVGGIYVDSTFFYNNFIAGNYGSLHIEVTYGYNKIHNNTIIGRDMNCGIYSVRDGSDIRNNIIFGVADDSMYSGIRSGGSFCQYNLCFNGRFNFREFTPDSTNFVADPMLASTGLVNHDAHLQMFSPAIDAGDPTILDVDGSRSDMGFYGGPYGEAYTYNDLAPRAPRALYGKIDTTKIRLAWKGGTERDFKNFIIYKDTTINFTPDSVKIVSIQRDTIYVDTLNPSLDKHYYYKITAIDSQDNVSLPSQEISFILLGVAENEGEIGNGLEYELYNNYPNPFNPSTSISFRMKNAGFVKLQVYNIAGELVSTIKNEYMEAGYHEVEYQPKSIDYRDIASGIYILRIDIKGENNIPVFNASRKMIYMK